jgi:hypothetical protein
VSKAYSNKEDIIKYRAKKGIPTFLNMASEGNIIEKENSIKSFHHEDE